MFKTIIVDGQEMELSANAATPFRFKQVFQKDLLAIFSNEKRAEQEGLEAVAELAYIMNNQAKKSDMNKLSYEGFIEWLEGFEPMAFVDASEDIIDAYTSQTRTTSTPKVEEKAKTDNKGV